MSACRVSVSSPSFPRSRHEPSGPQRTWCADAIHSFRPSGRPEWCSTRGARTTELLERGGDAIDTSMVNVLMGAGWKVRVGPRAINLSHSTQPDDVTVWFLRGCDQLASADIFY